MDAVKTMVNVIFVDYTFAAQEKTKSTTNLHEPRPVVAASLIVLHQREIALVLMRNLLPVSWENCAGKISP